MAYLRFLPEQTYHVYNRGNNYENIFFEERNFFYFLDLYQKYISPVADTLAFCLLLNHFHFLIRIKTSSELPENQAPHQRFSNMFNAYTKAINKNYGRRGSLFEKHLKRKHVDNDRYFRTLVIYIHRNPQTHGHIGDFREWPYSSYQLITTAQNQFVLTPELLRHFNDLHDFMDSHQHQTDDGIYETSRW